LLGLLQITKQTKFIVKSLLLVDIYYISIISFYQTFVKTDIILFITSLYKIDQIIKEKKAKAI
jgi:hypothetical protein